MSDRTNAICDLLLGAAYSDDHLHEREKQAISELLCKLLKADDLPAEFASRIDAFDASAFDVKACAAAFAGDDDDKKKDLLELVNAVHEADDEFDFAEDDYIRDVATALGLSEDALDSFTLEVEIEELGEGLGKLRASPPPVPR